MDSNSTWPPSLKLRHLWPIADQMDAKNRPTCPECIDRATTITTVYGKRGDRHNYEDAGLTRVAESVWPCKTCGFAPAGVHTVVVEVPGDAFHVG